MTTTWFLREPWLPWHGTYVRGVLRTGYGDHNLDGSHALLMSERLEFYNIGIHTTLFKV